MLATESQRQKTEADNFVLRVSAEFPYLGKMVGWQTIFDRTVEGMKQIGIYHSSVLTTAQFMAGLQHAISTGTLPKSPAPVPPEPTPEELAAKAEQERLAQEAERKARQDAETRRLWQKQNRARGLSEHEFANPVGEAAEAAEGIRKIFADQHEAQAKAEAESLSMYYLNGREDPNATAELQQRFVRDESGKILWRKTVELRKQIQNNHFNMLRKKRDMKG